MLQAPALMQVDRLLYHDPIDLICETISHYVIDFRMAKAHECPLAVMYMAVSGEA